MKISTGIFKVFLLACLFASQEGRAQTTVFSDDFATSQGASYTSAAGAIGSSSVWSMTRSGADWGARINGGILDLTNDAGATTNASGWIYGYTLTSGFSSPYNATLSSNPGVVTWTFNIRQIRSDPAGYGGGAYGAAFVLGSSSTTAATTGQGYAIVYGQSGSTDPVRLARFNNGIQGTVTNIITSNTSGLTDFGADYISVKVTYTPSTNTWELFLRNDGTSAFSDPASGTLTSQGTATDNTYTSTALGSVGGYWQGSTSANQTAYFDNFSVTVVSGSPTADINVKGNSVSIADGDVTPSATDHTQFTDTEAGFTSTRTFTIENAGAAGTINISSVSVSGTGFSISDTPDDNALATGESTTFDVQFAPNSIGAFSGTVTIANDDPDAGEQSYTFDIAGNGTVSQQSVVTAVASSEAATISSLNNIATITNSTEGVQVWQFRLYDGNGSANDGDGLNTIYTGMTINQGSGNTVTSWSSAIQDVRFFEGSTLITGTVTIGGVNIIFTPTTPISVNDGAASYREISMRLSLKNPLPANSDGQKFVFQLQKSNVSVQSAATSSQLSNFSNQISDNTKNVIDVAATQLVYTSIPPSAPLNNNFSVYVEARDANGNLDNGNTTSVTLAKTAGAGTFTVSSPTKNLVAGAASWTDANHNTVETITLQTSGSGLTPVSADVNIINAPYQLFDNFNRTSSSTVGIPSSGGLVSWTEDETGTSCSPTNTIIRVVNDDVLELSNCNQGSSASCGTTSSKQVTFDMNGKYATTFNTASSTMEWYFNLKHTYEGSSPSFNGLSGFGSGNYALAVILGSTSTTLMDNLSGTAQGYAVICGESGGTDPIRLVRFNEWVGNHTTVISGVGAGADFNADTYVSVKVTFTPSTNTWGLYVRDDGSSFADPTTISVSGATATNSTYTNLNLRYAGALWKHSSGCEEILTVDNFNIPVSTASLPEIKVEYTTNNAVEISDGGSFDFGPVSVSGGSYTATFTITNVGTGSLTLGTVGVSGGNSGDFTITQPGSTTLAPSATTTFTVTFDPSATGSRTTTLSFSNNDSDENPFNFTLNGTGATPPVINEFVADHTGTDDREFIEVFGGNSTDYSNMKLLVIEGEGANKGEVDNIFSVGTTDAAGYWWTGYQNNQIENGTITILLVMNFSGSLGQDLDADNNGVLDGKPWTRILDDVALRISGSDAAYSTTIIAPNFDGTFLTPGGASRIANGTDTDNISDWMRNDIDGWGLTGYAGTANANEAKNTPKRVNVRFNVWLGTTTVWTNAANWTVRVPNDTTEALIPTIGSSTYPNITGIVTYDTYGLYLSSTASNITIGPGAEIRNFYDCESFSNSTSFGAGKISFEGSVATNISGTFTVGEVVINNANGVTLQTGSAVNITDRVTLESGQLTISGSLNLKSSATKTAFIDDFTDPTPGTISGSVTLERYISSVASGNIFHYIGATSSADAGGKWGDDFYMGVNGTNGFVTPLDCNPASPALAQGTNYGGFFTYNESNVTDCYLTGWKVENINYTLAPGKGIAARIANGIVLDETGTYPNPVANVTVSNLTKTTANTVAYSRGYNLVANPFYAPLDLTGIVADLTADSDWDGSVYIYDPSSGNYSAYNFLSSNPSTINTNQGFFIRASNAAPQSSTLDFLFNKSRRTAASNTAFYRQPQQYAYGLNITVENNGKTDATLIAFDDAFTNGFDNGYDAMKLYNDVGIPSLYSKAGNDQQAIHALPLLSDSTRSIPLSILITASGTHTFTFSGIENFPATSLVWLEDMQTGMFYDLRQNPTYAFTAHVNDSNDRFMLHFTAPILTSATTATCAGSDGEISVHLPAGVEWSYTVKNEADALVARHTGNGGVSLINALPQGNYTVTFIYGGNYSVTENLTVIGAQQVVADFSSSLNTVNEGEEIQFTNNSAGATSYEWDFGDGTLISGVAEPTHAYFTEGTYSVTLRATNDDCASVFAQQIIVAKQPTVGVDNVNENNLTVFAHEGAVYVQFDFLRTEVAEVKITNILGQEIFTGNTFTEGTQVFRLSGMEAQYIFVRVKTPFANEVRKIFLD